MKQYPTIKFLILNEEKVCKQKPFEELNRLSSDSGLQFDIYGNPNPLYLKGSIQNEDTESEIRSNFANTV